MPVRARVFVCHVGKGGALGVGGWEGGGVIVCVWLPTVEKKITQPLLPGQRPYSLESAAAPLSGYVSFHKITIIPFIAVMSLENDNKRVEFETLQPFSLLFRPGR